MSVGAAIGTGTVIRCARCGSDGVEVCLPAYFKANDLDAGVVSVDAEADGLSYWCPACQDHVEVER